MCRKLIYLVSFVLVLGLTSSASADLMVHWKLDDGSGTTAIDSSGNGRNGTFVGTPEWADGYYGGGVHFTAHGQMVRYEFEAEESWPAGTVTMWVKADTVGQALWSSLFASHLPKPGFQIDVDGGDPGNYRMNPSGTIGPVNTDWVHIAVAWEGGSVNMYYNGTLSNSGAIGANNTLFNVFALGISRSGEWTLMGVLDDFRVYDVALTAEEIAQTMIVAPPGTASEPSPADEATDVPRDVVLSWTPGEFVAELSPKHKVFFSESFDDANDGIDGITQDPNLYPVGAILDFGKTYYWRVDEADSTSGWEQGRVWQFTVEPFAYLIPGEDITATASSSYNESTGPENTVNGSGLDVDDLHSAEQTDMWLSSPTGPQPTWIQYGFDRVYKLHEMWVWNFNQAFELVLGFGLKDVTIEYSADGIDWVELAGVPEFAQASGAVGYAHDTTLDFGGVAAKYVKITANSNWGLLNQYGLSEVNFFYTPVQATKPNPDSGATDVDLDLVLGWRAGRQAAKHEVYFSSDEQAVIDRTTPVTNVTETSYGPLSLDLGKTYYWRVDEVNEAETPAMCEGDVWDFTTHEYFVVDDFESYDDYEPNRVFDTWIDGWDDPTNGSTVGYAEPDWDAGEHHVETQIVHSGRQSMPFFYDNNFGNSEATMTLSSQRDWTIRGAGALSLWFRGYPASFSTFTEEPLGSYMMTARCGDIWGTSDQLNYVFKQLSGPGSIAVKVESITNTSNSAKAGVMIRDTLDPDSKHTFMCLRPDGGIRFNRRVEVADSTSSSVENGLAFPHWVKLDRDAAGRFTASHSSDGINWAPVNDTNLGSSATVQMNTVVYIGFALSSNNTDETCEFIFSDVQVTGAVTGQWQSQDIGILSNDPEPMYVAVANSTGPTAVAYHEDLNATRMDTWTEWNIDLQAFADQGVNLTNVDKLSIGFGDRNPDVSGQTGSSGKMYFDDIRLYPLREP